MTEKNINQAPRTAHTPGPWKALPGNGGRSWPAIWTQNGSDFIAQLSCGARRPWKVALADADLIAAAPDMLDALKFAKEVIDDQSYRFHRDCRCQLCESLPQTINAAIAKAEGRNA